MKVESTAIIVNARGEVFVGWRAAVSISGNGWEDYYTVPEFGIPKSWVIGPNDFRMTFQKTGDIAHINRPYVFSSVRAAKKAMERMRGHGELAVVS